MDHALARKISAECRGIGWHTIANVIDALVSENERVVAENTGPQFRHGDEVREEIQCSCEAAPNTKRKLVRRKGPERWWIRWGSEETEYCDRRTMAFIIRKLRASLPRAATRRRKCGSTRVFIGDGKGSYCYGPVTADLN